MTTVIYNGKFYLNRGNFCEAVLVENGRIAKTGSSRDLLEAAHNKAEKSEVQKIDAQGALVLPAFHDGHLHLLGLGRRAGGIEGTGANSIDDIIGRGRELIAALKPPAGTYITGAGVNPDLFTSGEKRDLRRYDLDKISIEHPVIISRHCGHTIYCNSLALKLAGIGDSAPNVEGGTIEKDESGRPTGVCRENANALVRKPMPPPSPQDIKRCLNLAMKKAHSLGITACGSFDTGGPDFENVRAVYSEIYDESRKAGVPALRVSMQWGISASEKYLDELCKKSLDLRLEQKIKISGSPDIPLWEDSQWGTFLKMGPLKLFIDGTLGGRTAWMLRPYHDMPETRGFPVIDPQTLNRYVQKAAVAGMQVIIHAIGDAGFDAALSAFERITNSRINSEEVNLREVNPLRHSVIHCQITSPGQLERMARNNIGAMVQPIFLKDDIHMIAERVGPGLASTSYAWGSMQRLGIRVSYGTDAPVSGLDPLDCIEWAVFRGGPDAACGIYAGETVDVSTAVDAYTTGSACATFSDNNLGRIAPGFFADLVFLDRDIFTMPPQEIHTAKVLRTMCAGETVYSVM